MRWIEHRLPTNVELVPIKGDGALPDAVSMIEFMITSGAEFPASQLKAIFAAAKSIKVVQTLSAGVNMVTPYVQPHMTLCNASGSHDVAVAEWCMAVILSRLRQLPAFWDAQQQSKWEPATKQMIQTGHPDVGPLDDLEGKEVLIIGHGSIGRALETRLLPFGARVAGIARTAREGVHSMSELKALLPKADIVVILVPLTPETHHLVDADFLATMKQGAMLVNAGRGPQVDTQALLAALQKGHITAALDVTDPEPLPADHPLWKAPGILITPHIGGAVKHMRARGYKFVLEQLDKYLAGEPLMNVRLHGY
ncbi:g9937 [Coccomyxa viridis]|uniref:G9937 protein n=1 Tax=Coccomyxa viridis TaxID=1274662 RepID=A0ABP1G6U7_9CHLO